MKICDQFETILICPNESYRNIGLQRNSMFIDMMHTNSANIYLERVHVFYTVLVNGNVSGTWTKSDIDKNIKYIQDNEIIEISKLNNQVMLVGEVDNEYWFFYFRETKSNTTMVSYDIGRFDKLEYTNNDIINNLIEYIKFLSNNKSISKKYLILPNLDGKKLIFKPYTTLSKVVDMRVTLG